MKKIAVLTGGGDCPGLNAVLRSLVLTLEGAGGPEVVGLCDAYHGLLEDPPRVMHLDGKTVDGILVEGGTILGTSNSGDPFAWNDGEDRGDFVLKRLKALGVGGLVSIGGDGSTAIAAELQKRGLPVICVPKTIDNDVHGTDVTFGFDSAVHCATEALDRLQTTGESHRRVMVLETMGRDAGWIALASGIAGGVDVILLPEVPFSYDRVVSKILEERVRGLSYNLVVVAEGAAEEGKGPIYRDPKHKRLGGVGAVVARQIEQLAGIETRATILGHLQRGGSPSPGDRVLATTFGCAAAHCVLENRWDVLVGMNDSQVHYVPLDQVAGKVRMVPEGHPLMQTAQSLGICLG